MVTSTIGMDTELQVEPMTRCTLFWLMNRLTLAMPLSGLHSSSSRITSIFAPLMPPLALTASSSLFAMSPYAIPDSTIIRSVMPTRMVLSCATAGLAARHRPSRAAAPAARAALPSMVFIMSLLLAMHEPNDRTARVSDLPNGCGINFAALPVEGSARRRILSMVAVRRSPHRKGR